MNWRWIAEDDHEAYQEAPRPLDALEDIAGHRVLRLTDGLTLDADYILRQWVRELVISAPDIPGATWPGTVTQDAPVDADCRAHATTVAWDAAVETARRIAWAAMDTDSDWDMMAAGVDWQSPLWKEAHAAAWDRLNTDLEQRLKEAMQ